MIKNIFKKSPKRLRKEKVQRELERKQEKDNLQRLAQLYKSKEAKKNYMRNLERLPTFNLKYENMKKLLLDPDIIKKDKVDNILSKPKTKFHDFFKL